MGEWVIEPATVEALPGILQIEEACFSAPWTRKMLEAELSGNPFAHFLLAKQVPPGEAGSVSIVGYLCFWVVFEEVRLMNLAVIESMRHKGIARALVVQALETGVAQAWVSVVRSGEGQFSTGQGALQLDNALTTSSGGFKLIP